MSAKHLSTLAFLIFVAGSPSLVLGQPSQIGVCDANGNFVAQLLDVFGLPNTNQHPSPASWAHTVLEVEGRIVPLAMTPNGEYRGLGREPSAEAVYFESNDCTGTALIALSEYQQPNFQGWTVVGAGTLYFGDVDTTAPRNLRSRLLNDDSSCSPISQDDQETMQAVPILDLDAEFQPPLSLCAAPALTVSVPAVGVPGLLVLALTILVWGAWLLARRS